jgi:hypothetical protein
MTPLPTVLLHVGADYKTPVAGARQNAGIHTWLLDMHPVAGARTQFTDAGFRVGESFTDPAGGITITVTAMDAQKATVQVDMPNSAGTGPVCLDGTAFDPAASTSCSATVVGTDAGPPVIIDAGGVVTGAGGARADAGRDAATADAGRGGAGGAAGATGVGGDTPIGIGAGGTVLGDGSLGAAGEFVVPNPDGSTGGPMAGAAQDAAAPAASSPGAENPVQGGCGCRVGADTGRGNRAGLGAGMVLFAALIGARRRGSRCGRKTANV